MIETYIPNARDAVVAYFGRDEWGNLRSRCVRCNDASPLASATKIYGEDMRTWIFDSAGNIVPHDPYAPRERTSLAVGHFGAWDTVEACESCGVTVHELSCMCQREHDEQQVRFARGPVTALVECGVSCAPRCRIY